MSDREASIISVKLGLLVLLATGLVWLSLSCERGNRRAAVTTPFIYGQEDVTKWLSKRGIDLKAVSHVSRNASGSELYIYPFPSASNSFSIYKVTTNGLTTVPAPGRGAILGADGGFVVWFTDDAIRFKDGDSITLPPFALFDVDPSGTYFIIGEKPSRTWLGRVRSPLEKRVIADDLLAGSVFVSGDRVYVAGTTYTRSLATCLILRHDDDDFETVERLSFDWAAGVVDVDPFSDRLLLWDRATVSSAVYAYDLSTKQRQRIGRVQGFQFFLVSDLLK